MKPQVRPRLRNPGLLEEILRTIVFVIVVTVLFDMAIPRSLVDGRSMMPTFFDGERLIVSRVHYLLVRPHRGDVIVFNSVEDDDIMLIKRVIGLPGDTIEFREQHLYINGQLVDEPYINEACDANHCHDEVWTLGPDQYFVMGDNRNSSRDSRRFDPIPLDHIVGRVIFRYYPIRRIGVVNAADYGNLEP